jgi:hypothetical protein
MQPQTRKKVLAVVVALGLTAVALDRLMLSDQGPAPAAAAPVVKPAGQTTLVAPLRSSDATPHHRLTQRLDELDHEGDTSPIADVFVVPADWHAVPPAEVQTPVGPAAGPSAAERFSRAHTLQAVVLPDRGAAAAIINGRVVRLGDEVAGYRLMRVEPGTAMFVPSQHQGQAVRLRVAPTR